MYTPDKWTDKQLAVLEKRIAKIYKDAEKDLNKEVQEYFAKFKLRDKEMQKLVQTGDMTKDAYQQWRLTQIGRGQRFEALRDKLAERFTQANEVANAYVNDSTPSIYSLNRNYEAYTIEKAVGNCDFTMWDESTVRRLLVSQPDLMPYYPPKRALSRGIDLDYGKSQITKHVTSGILRGLAPSKIASELMTSITSMNRESAVRAARTGVTAAQNAGRMDSYVAAEKMGIQIKRRWVCTKDSRTRKSHGKADGQIVTGTKEPFRVGGYKMMFPGDKSLGAPGHEIYNCRCTTRTVEKDGIEAEPRQMRVKDPVTGENVLVNEMTYSEWQKWKETGKKPVANSGGDGILKAQKATKVEDMTRELQEVLKEYTNGNYTEMCNYTQYLVDSNSLRGNAGFWEENILPNISEQTKKNAVDILNTIQNQPVDNTLLYRIERRLKDKQEFENGDIIKMGIRSTSKDSGFAEAVFSGEIEGFDADKLRFDGDWVEYRFVNSRQLDIESISLYPDQRESLIAGAYRVVNVEEIKNAKGGWNSERIQVEKYLERENIPYTPFVSKSGKAMIRYTEDGKEKTSVAGREITAMLYEKPQFGRTVVYLEVAE